MGQLLYGAAPAIQIEDWGLQHLQAVMLTKLRRDESFSFSWDNEPDVDGDATEPVRGHHGTVWISKSTPLYFSYDAPRHGPLNKRWLAALAVAAGSSSGTFRLLPEPM
ncbi:hypothetical protein [Microbacterium sp.]|uniref:DUF7882 family protein n=1 Tax=Microbacterium sp. TaxID=51671 RepID=UPI002E346129|nr:hypothetical protein [Microbacterium sp.]HEX5730844.1 hypothetical protein [Microbacterium sp.]